MMRRDAMLDEYDRVHDTLTALCAHHRAAIEARLESEGIKVHLVSGRVKSRESLAHKLARPDRTYGSLWSVTDLVGIRVTVYFEDAIDDVARALEAALPVDFTHSADKMRPQDHGRFGYRSLHYVCALADPRDPSALDPEARFEVQVRTVVQHAWAEVEHDLGYKSHEAVPAAIRRRFSRVASLLEIADEEFVSIRRAIEAHAQSAREAVVAQERAFPLDAVSLHAIATSDEVAALDAAVAASLDRPLSDEVFYPEYLTRMLLHAGLATTRDVHEALTRHGAEAVSLVGPYFDFASSAWRLTASSLAHVHRGYALFFLAHVVILRAPESGLSRVSRLTRLYRELDYPDDERTAQQVAGALLRALQGA